MRLRKPVPIQREALGSQVANALREAIAAGELVPGQRLIETDLAEMYGVSRGPVRDAMRILQIEGLIESQPPGMVVVGIDEEAIGEIYSLRGAIEGLAIRLAVERCDEEMASRLLKHVDLMERAASSDNAALFAQADVAFHNEICLVSRHRRLADVWQRYEPIMMTLLRLTISLNQDLVASAGKHRELTDLIRSGDPDAAEAELSRHLDGSRERMVAVWERALARRREEAANLELT